MNPSLSVYLDALRFLAAFWVFLAHFQAWGFAPPGLQAVLPESGRDAVVIFFVLSGFVIAHTANRRDARTFSIDRLARLYSVALPIVLVSTAIEVWGASNGFKGFERFYQLDNIYLYIPLYLTFLGDAWYLNEVPFANIPYWSLDFEFWYYVLFGVAFYMRGVARACLLGLILLAVGFKLWLLWPLWLAGVWLHYNIERWPLPMAIARCIMIATVAAFGAMEAFGFDEWLWSVGGAPFGDNSALVLGNARFYLSDYATGLLAMAHLYAARYAELHYPPVIIPAIRWAAGFTFTLYLAHGPLLTLFGIFCGKTAHDGLSALLLLIGVLAAVVAIGYLTERRVAAWRRGTDWTFGHLERLLPSLRRHVA